jgi:hypothetical protein
MSREPEVTRAVLFVCILALVGVLAQCVGLVESPAPMDAEERWRQDHGR